MINKKKLPFISVLRGDLSQRYTEYDDYGDYTCDYQIDTETTEHAIGPLADLATAFPHDQNVKAWLLSGEDCNAASVTPAIIYHGCLQTVDGAVVSDAKYGKKRAVVMRKMTHEICGG